MKRVLIVLLVMAMVAAACTEKGGETSTSLSTDCSFSDESGCTVDDGSHRRTADGPHFGHASRFARRFCPV